MSESKIIKGEIEGWAKEPNKFKGGRGSLGLKVEGEWHNLIGKMEDLNRIQREFPKGTIIQFAEYENARGYLDIVENSIKEIDKKEAYSEPEKKGRPQSEDRKEKDFVSCFMAAVDIQIKILEDGLRRGNPFRERAAISKVIADHAKQLYLDFQKSKEDLKKEGKW